MGIPNAVKMYLAISFSSAGLWGFEFLARRLGGKVDAFIDVQSIQERIVIEMQHAHTALP